jgi:N-acetylglucosamine-6-sulfatase
VISLLRTVLAATLLLAGAALMVPERPATTVVSTSAPVGPARPNVLVIMTDDMRYDELLYVPTVRREIQQRGLTWSNAFSTTPLCCPARASFFTGKLEHNHGVLSHRKPYGYQAFDDSHTLATALRAVGYQTGFVGKYLNGYGPDRPKEAPRRANSFTYVPNGWTDWRGSVDQSPFHAPDPRSGSTYNYFHMTLNVNGRLVGHPRTYSSDVVADNTRAILHRFTARSAPWFVVMNPVNPHYGGPREPDDPAPGFKTPARPGWVKGKYDDVIRRAPGLPPGPTEKDISDKIRATRRFPELGPGARGAVTRIARQRAESLFALDRSLGPVFAQLESSGELANTIIVFTSDNGYMLGEHHYPQGKVVGYDPSYRIPMLMAGPGIPQGTRSSPITLVDLSATILKWTGATLAGGDGRSVIPDIAADHGWKRPLVYESKFPGVHARAGVQGFDNRTAIGVRTARFMYTRYASGESELFDLRKDPLELQSVAGWRTYAGVRGALMKVWRQIAYCKRSACQPLLPASLATDASATTQLRDLLTTAQADYYGVPR